MKTIHSSRAGVIALVIAVPARADTFGTGGNAFTINFVTIGNPGNGDDAPGPIYTADGGNYASPFGGVSYAYRMAITEVPQNWITNATNSGLANVTAGAWAGMKPAANMTWYEAAAFVNWLNTSTGQQPAYNLTFDGIWSLSLWTSGEAWQLGDENRYRHKNAFYFLPSEDEWYKSAYYNGANGYADYPTGSNSVPVEVTSGTSPGTALYNNTAASPADVDANGGLSHYGTRGQGGNVFEWVETEFDGINDQINSTNRAIRGGAWYFGEDGMRSSVRLSYGPGSTGNDLGFRVASVPEPTTAVSLLLGGGFILARRKRPI